MGFVYVRTTKLVQASTRPIACSSYAMLEQYGSTRSTCRTCRVVSRRDVTSQVEFGLI